jgi:hypothetical protein
MTELSISSTMQQLVAMRMTHNCTMLILAHTPKRKQGDPLTIDDLAGSKLLSNFADNIIGFNKSRKMCSQSLNRHLLQETNTARDLYIAMLQESSLMRITILVSGCKNSKK